MLRDYDGLKLLDSAGETVGTIERSYLEDSGAVRYVDVKLGFLGRHHLVPADRGTLGDGSLQVPYLKDVIEESPTISTGDTLEGDDLQAVQEYYSNDFGASGAVTMTPDAADGEDDSPDISEIEAASLEERNRPANDLGDTVQSEEAPAGLAAVRDLGDVVEIPIVEEVLVKKPVVREVLRISKSRLAEQGVAAADVRREDVEVVSTSADLVTTKDES